MTHRSRACLFALAITTSLAAAPAAAFGAGFSVPSGNTFCAIITAKQAGGGGAGLYCSSRYVKVAPEAAIGGAKLLHSGKGRKIAIGNDEALRIEGDYPTQARPVLKYGKSWKRDGYTCTSRSTGLTCRRGSHGFFLSRESQRFF